jgi:hypothetical protein
MLWDQHRERYEAGGYLVRRITYCRFRELTKEVTAEDMARIGRLNAKRESGATLTPEETDTLTAIAGKWPVDALRGACFIPPVSGDKAVAILAELPRAISEDLEKKLDEYITPEIPADDTTDPLAMLLVATGGLGIDIADMTVGQGYAITAMLAPKEE